MSFFYDRDGRIKRLLVLTRIEGIAESYVCHFRSPVTEKDIKLQFSRAGLEKAGLRPQDFREAPSFVTEDYASDLIKVQIDFICGRLKKIIRIRMRVSQN